MTDFHVSLSNLSVKVVINQLIDREVIGLGVHIRLELNLQSAVICNMR